MIIEPVGSTVFATSFSEYDVVGFHASSMSASYDIETVGLLPHKILDEDTHQRLLEAASALGIATNLMGGYAEWLDVKSVTFTKTPDAAIGHAMSGRSGGQGLVHINAILEKVKSVADFKSLVTEVQAKLTAITDSGAIVYAVNLSGLGARLVDAPDSPKYYRVYWNPSHPLPSVSVVGPDRLIARLSL